MMHFIIDVCGVVAIIILTVVWIKKKFDQKNRKGIDGRQAD